MKTNQFSHIRQLMVSELMGHATQEESEELQKLLGENPTIQKEYEELKQEFSSENKNNPLDRVASNWSPGSAIVNLPTRRDVRIRMIRRISVAATLIFAIIATTYLLRDSQKTRQPAIASVDSISQIHPIDQVSLTVGNGKTIGISSGKDSFSAGGANFKTSNKVLSYSFEDADKTDGQLISMNRLIVPIGKDYQVILSDGTEIWLNSATQLDFPFQFNTTSREVNINGEAYLKVAKQQGKPFLVHTPRGTVQVLGTEFNINSYDSGVVKVSLVEGAVRFDAGGKHTFLKPGKEAVYSDNEGDIAVRSFDRDITLAWRSGEYVFKGATLEQVCRVLPRWYGIRVQLDKNARISNDNFDGVVSRNKPIKEFLENLKYMTGVNYYFDDKGTLYFK